MTVAAMATDNAASSGTGRSATVAMTLGSWSPMSTKASPLTTKMVICQVPTPRTRVSELITRGARYPTSRPPLTAASTPDTWSCSAGR